MFAVRITIVGCVCAFSLAVAARGQDSDQAAAKIFERTCGACHDTATATSERHTRGDWKRVTDDMISRGAAATPDEMLEIVGWLARHYGDVQINELPADSLQNEMQLTHEEADAIVSYRSKHGKFEDFKALKNVPGVDGAKLESYKDSIVY